MSNDELNSFLKILFVNQFHSLPQIVIRINESYYIETTIPLVVAKCFSAQNKKFFSRNSVLFLIHRLEVLDSSLPLNESSGCL